MAFTELKVDWRNIIKLTNTGLYVAPYADLRKAVVEGFKSIYGDDIDVSTATADGVYIDMYCLIVNNILQSIRSLYNNLDVNQANGKYLETLCALSNVFRKEASYSSAVLKCTLDESATTSYEPEANEGIFSVIDDNGITWTHKKDPNNLLVFEPGVPQYVVVKCDDIGPQAAPAGSITKLVNNEVTMEIIQEENAYIGDNEESDSDLRARRNNSLSGSGISVLESLSAALLSLQYVRDVKIYNNNSAVSVTAKDGTVIALHKVYICLRYDESILTTIEKYDASIGSLIYEKMTPGIETVVPAIEKKASYNYPVISYLSGRSLPYEQIVNWKICESVKPKLVMNLKQFSGDHFTLGNATTIVNKMVTYLNTLSIGTDLTAEDLKYKVREFDPQYRGRDLYTVTSITVAGQTSYNNPDTYYQYTPETLQVEDIIEEGEVVGKKYSNTSFELNVMNAD